jgi:predicted methyltransferase
MRRFTTCLLIAGAALATTLQPATAEEADPALLKVIEARSEADRARDAARHPAETLTFFQMRPGMTVAEALPGGGWYTRILANYLGGDATLYGINYVDRMWPMFSSATEEWIAKRLASTKAFAEDVAGYTDNGITARGFTFNTVPEMAVGKVDRVLLIRALHNLNRFESKAGTLTQALAAVRGMLKPGGLVGVVQHRLPESAPDEGADGSRGYLKQSTVVAAFEAAGFELVASSEINANPKDQPGPDDIVWRLPPSLNGSKDDPEKRAAMEAIGESDRMTLLFRKGD